MCELFGVSAENKIRVNGYLETFFKRSIEHHNGWGLALLDNGLISIEREPVRAVDSLYLKNRLTENIETAACIAHIRKATIGDVSFTNTHPFVLNDSLGRKWILVHNGTIFDSPELKTYLYQQSGTTDSERILYFIVDSVNKSGFNVSDNERFDMISGLIHKITPGNKVNFLLYDGENMYVHKNEKGTLFSRQDKGAAIFATNPLDDSVWNEIPQNTLLVYRKGKIIYKGTPHNNTYVHDEEKMRLIYMDHAML